MTENSFNSHIHLERKRDAYGFAVRPQHLQRFREYGNIYKEEEEERSQKWNKFLEQQIESAQPISEEEKSKTLHTETTKEKAEATSERGGEGNDSSDRNASYGATECDPQKEFLVAKGTKVRTVQTWAEIRESLGSIESLMSLRVKKKKKFNMKEEKIAISQNLLQPIEESRPLEGGSEEDSGEELSQVEEAIEEARPLEEVPKEEFVEALDQVKEARPSEEVPREGFEEAPDQVKESIEEARPLEGVPEDAFDEMPEQVEEARSLEGVQIKEAIEEARPLEGIPKVDFDKASDQVEEASDQVKITRPLEGVLKEDFDEASNQVEEAVEGERPLEGVSKEDFEEELNKVEEVTPLEGVNKILYDSVNASIAASDDSGGVTQEPFFPWKEELECLVRGGVPMALRGEVWQAFVGVRSRRVEGYYQDLLVPENHAGDSNERCNSSDVSMKCKKQIEKVIRCGPWTLSFNLFNSIYLEHSRVILR